VDLATMQTLALATGGSRGDVVRAAPDGRVFLSQSHEIDVLSPVVAPRVASTNPPADAAVALPLTGFRVTFDHAILASPAADPHPVLHPANYRVVGDLAGPVPVRAVAYDPASRTAVLTFDALAADRYRLTVQPALRSTEGLGLADAYTTRFLALSNLT